MTVVPIRLHRRTTPAAPLNHSARICPGCLAMPLREHGLACPKAATEQQRRLAYPADARVFRGWINALILVAPLYIAVIALIWSN